MKGQLRKDVILADYTTWRVGGPAAQFYEPTDLHDLSCFLKTIPEDTPITFLGLGSNSLIRDGGIEGVVILTQGCLNGLVYDDPGRIRVEAGISCAKMARFVARCGLKGGEFWAGIPGTMGGALRMNAGCHGGETWEFVVSIETMTRDGMLHHRAPDEFSVAYRHVEGLGIDEWFVAATFQFPQGLKEHSLQKIKDLLAKRAETQPTHEFNCGSVFRNPPQHYAAQLIEAAGLKGACLGGAKISEKHANFIVNYEGQATAQDIESLILKVQEDVFKIYGIDLVQEVHLLGKKNENTNMQG